MCALRSPATKSLAAAAFGGSPAGACDAGCTILDVTTLTGIVGDSANGKACAGVELKRGTTCDLKLDDGYTGNGGTTTHSCPSASTTLSGATLATTGCAADYKQNSATLKTPVTATGAAVTSSDQGTCGKW